MRLSVGGDVGDGGGRDRDGAVGDVLAGRAVDLSVGRLDSRRQGLHAVDALGGVGEARLRADALARARAAVHVGILGRLGAALGRDGYEGLGRGGSRGDWRGGLLVGGNA